MKTTLRAASLAGLVLALAASAHAQRTTGTISGTVKDTTGAVLPGVAVSVSGPNIVGTQTAVTNEQRLSTASSICRPASTRSLRPDGLQDPHRRGVRVGVGSQHRGERAPSR